MLRALVAATVALALSAGAAAAASPAPGTLGGGIDPAPVNVDVGSTFKVTDYSTLSEAVTLSVSGTGYAVSPDTFTLAPGASQTVNVVAIGTGPGLLTAHILPVGPTGPGVAAGLVLSTQLEHKGVPVDWRLPILLALALLALAVLVTSRRLLQRPAPAHVCNLHGVVHPPGAACRGSAY